MSNFNFKFEKPPSSPFWKKYCDNKEKFVGQISQYLDSMENMQGEHLKSYEAICQLLSNYNNPGKVYSSRLVCDRFDCHKLMEQVLLAKQKYKKTFRSQ
jgi:hypothetical protein